MWGGQAGSDWGVGGDFERVCTWNTQTASRAERITSSRLLWKQRERNGEGLASLAPLAFHILQEVHRKQEEEEKLHYAATISESNIRAFIMRQRRRWRFT